MSILIKGAKPPSGCRWCYFNDDSKCALIVGCDLDGTNGTQRRKECPLIELPNDDEFAKEMKIASGQYDEEQSHIAMDGVMCDLLKKLGYVKAMEIFENAEKWYT